MRINDNKQNFTSLSVFKKPLEVFYNQNSTLPTLAVETGVTILRSIEAKKRGGKIESTERFIEQGTSALVWIYGVGILNKLNNYILKNVFKIKNLDFDIGFDALRNPVKNNHILTNNSKALCGKCANIILSISAATAFIGFVLPKINHFITNSLLKKEKEKPNTTLKPISIQEYKNKTKNHKEKISFTSIILEKMNSFAHLLENNQNARLFITDIGVVGGRFHNGRNKYEKIEGLFRDISSIFFYLKGKDVVVYLLNKMTNNVSINPKTLNSTVEMLGNYKFTKKNFLSKALGKEIKKEDLTQLQELFEDKKVIPLEDFLAKFPNTIKKATQMSELQPVFEDKRFLSFQEAKDVLSKGVVSYPKFLKKAYEATTDGKSSNPLRYVSQKYLEKTRNSIDEFIIHIDSKLKDEIVTKEAIEKIANSVIRKNFLYNCVGTVATFLALGILIPKIQYFITKKLTNENKFPGIQEYK